MQRQAGTVKFYDSKEGYGFAINDNGDDVLILRQHLPDCLNQGVLDEIAFDQVNTIRGLMAVNVITAD